MEPLEKDPASVHPDLVFRQIEVGPMANFVYLVGSRRTRECLLVDPAWDIPGLLEIVDREELELKGVVVTHGHPDHAGGDLFGLSVRGVADLIAQKPVPVHVNRHEEASLRKATGLSGSDVVPHDGDDVLELGDLRIRLIHTPGHTPGGQCLLIHGVLISGDTLFVGACGRIDLPGANSQDMYESLTQKLGKLPPETQVYPGHASGGRNASTIGEELRTNPYLRIGSLEEWRQVMGD